MDDRSQKPMPPGKRKLRKNCFRCFSFMGAFVWTIPFLYGVLTPTASHASTANFLYRIDVKPRQESTRLTFNLENDSDYSLSILSGNRIRIAFPRTFPIHSKKLRTYSDPRIESISLSERKGCCLVTVAVKDVMSGYRLIAPVRKNIVSLDIGPGVKGVGREPSRPGREKIWSGTERLIREFEPSLKADVPFIPTGKKELEGLMNKDDAKLFAKGEAAIYDEKPAEAAEIFKVFSSRDIPARGMAECRLGEALYKLQKYSEALSAFREAEKSDPAYLFVTPAAVFDYADCLAREGEFEAGRRMLVRLIDGLAGTGHGTSLLVHLADICRRAGHDMEAIAIYRNIVSSFPGTLACYAASMRLDDKDFFSINSATYRGLLERYRYIYTHVSVPSLRDESMFKAALLQSLYGPAGEAVAEVDRYEKIFPHGIFNNIAKAIHEHLLLVLYHKFEKEGDCRGLLDVVQANSDYLSECIAEKGFAQHISKCYLEFGMKLEEMSFFMKIADSEWAVEAAPFMYSRILEDAFALNELAIAESVGRSFLERFPKNSLAWDVIGRLGEIYFRKGKMTEVVAILSRIDKKGGCAVYPESFYFLGKARQSLHDLPAAERDMALFNEELAKKGYNSPFEADALMVRAEAMISRGDDKGAVAMYRAGYAIADDDFRDACLYKMGELYERLGDVEAAKNSWEMLVKDSKDPIWKKMASDQLSELEWNARWKNGGR
jgi:tetratricopeptide (TPR) repeat protein